MPNRFSPPELLELGLWIADYYVAPIGEVYRAMLPLRADTRRARLVRLSELGQQKLQEINAGQSEEPAEPAGDLLNYLATRGSASVQVLRQKFSEAFLEALKEKWLVVDEVERERTQRQVYAVRLAGPVPEKPLRLSPVAKRILEALGAEGVAGDHRELLQHRRADLAALKKLSASGLVELDAFKGRTPFGPTSARIFSAEDAWAEADSSLVLTSAQNTALDDLTRQWSPGNFRPCSSTGSRAAGRRKFISGSLPAASKSAAPL